MADVHLSSMSLSDYEEALKLWMSDATLGVAPQFDTKARIGAYLDRNPGLSTIARKEEGLVGTALCGHDGRRGSIFHVTVASQFRRQGIARSMVKRCLKGLKQEGIDTAYLFTLRENEPAIQFWESIGWKSAPNILYHYAEF